MRKQLGLAIIVAAAVLSPARSNPVSIRLPEPAFVLKPGTGADVTETACQACHSFDYILTQPSHMGTKFWDAEVHKMIKSFGAPISETDAQTIAAYVGATY